MTNVQRLGLAMLLACGQVREGAPLPPGQPATGAQAWAASVSARLADDQLQVRRRGDALRFVSPRTGMNVTLEASGAAVLEARGGVSPRLRTTALGEAGRWVDVGGGAPREGACAGDGARRDLKGDCLRRVEVEHAGVVQWWSNSDDGLLQGWTVDAPPRVARFVVQVAVEGLPVSVSANGDRIRLGVPGAGVEGIGLRAWDAKGAALDVRAEVTDEGFQLVVDTAGAEGAVEIDPLWVPWDGSDPGGQDFRWFGGGVATGDLNGDGATDLVAVASAGTSASAFDDRVLVYLGVEDGTLPAAPTHVWTVDGGVRALGLLVTDLQGDGVDDVVVGEPWAAGIPGIRGRVLVYSGSSSGPLSGVPVVAIEGPYEGAKLGGSLAVGDLNGDGRADLIASGAVPTSSLATYEGVQVYFQSASGTFPATPDVTWSDTVLGLSPFVSLAAGDVNGDGVDDAVVGAPYHGGMADQRGSVAVFFGSRTGPLALAPDATLSEGRAGLRLGWTVAVGDVNGDGVGDVVGAAPNTYPFSDPLLGVGGYVHIYAGVQGGVPAAEPSQVLVSDQVYGPWGSALVVADVNADGRADVLAGGPTSENGEVDEGRVALVLGRSAWGGDWPVAASWESNVPGARLGVALAVGDLTGDGLLDVVAAAPWYDLEGWSPPRGRVFVYPALTPGSFETAPTPLWEGAPPPALDTYPSLAPDPIAIAVGDVNGDGADDVVAGSPRFGGWDFDEGRVVVYLGAQGGAFSMDPAVVWEGEQAGTLLGEFVAVGDITGDAIGDVVVRASNPLLAGVSTVKVFGGASAEGFAMRPLVTWGLGAACGGGGLGVGDVNGDGVDDVAAGCPNASGQLSKQGSVSVWAGSSTGTFDPNRFAWWWGGGERRALGTTLAVADVMGDAALDVVVSTVDTSFSVGGRAGQVHVHPGSLTGTFSTAPAVVWAGAQAWANFGSSLAVADVDGDGVTDVVVGSPDQAGVSQHEGRIDLFLGSKTGPPALSPAAHWDSELADARLGRVVALADVNGDGHADLFAPWSRRQSGESNLTGYLSDQGALPSVPSWQAGFGLDVPEASLSSLAVGDLNGDTFEDLVVGSSSCPSATRASCVYVLFGSPIGLQLEPPVLDGDGDGAWVGTDCDDEDPTRYPGAPERCGNDVDDDCDGAVDESDAVDATWWFADRDGDGFGSPFTGTRACTAPSLLEDGVVVPFVAAEGDCDDGDVDLRPGASEPCDGIDNDCDGLHYLGGRLTQAERTYGSWIGVGAGQRLGSVVGSLGDQQGTGGEELVLGLPGVSYGALHGGVVLVHYDALSPGDRAVNARVEGGWSVRIVTDRRDTRLGTAVASGDLNGDGVEDLVVGGPGSRVPDIGQGAVYVFFGPLAEGTRDAASADLVVLGSGPGARAGEALAVGDHDGDGYDDLLIGEPGRSGGAGAVYLVFGGPSLPAEASVADGVASPVGGAGDAAGAAVAFADVDGDGDAEVIVAAPSRKTWGEVALWSGTKGSTRRTQLGTPDAWLRGDAAGTAFGITVVNVGDLTGDGLEDVAVGTQAPGVGVFAGTTRGWRSGPARSRALVWFGTLTPSGAGRVVGRVGDLNGDGVDDLALGAPSNDSGLPDRGAVFLVYGGPHFGSVVPAGGVFNLHRLRAAVLPGDPPQSALSLGVFEGARILGASEGEGWGAVVHGADLDGDGIPELLVGRPSASDGAEAGGGVAMLKGGPHGIDTGPTGVCTVTGDTDDTGGGVTP